MQGAIYVLAWVAALCGLWLLWSYGLRPFALDAFRERIFELRFCLFRLAADGELPFDSDAYRMLETLMCGLLRFGHRVTFLTYVFSSAEQFRAKKAGEFVDVSAQIALKVSRLDPATQAKLKKIIGDAHTAIVVYMAFTSLFLMALLAAFGTAKLLGLWRPNKAELSHPVEQEAYRAETHRPLQPAMA